MKIDKKIVKLLEEKLGFIQGAQVSPTIDYLSYA